MKKIASALIKFRCDIIWGHRQLDDESFFVVVILPLSAPTLNAFFF